MPRRMIIAGMLALVAAGPFLLGGATCGPPGQPAIIGIVPPDFSGDVDVPVADCIDGFVCIELLNSTPTLLNFQLYLHNGYDRNNFFADAPSFECCTNPNSQTACPCPCEGAETGDCLLDRDEIFLDINLYEIFGQEVSTLLPGQSLLERVRCEDVKSLGVTVDLVFEDIDTDDPDNPNPIDLPEDAAGPEYRDERDGVSCGGTIQFRAVDLNSVTGGGSTIGDGTTADNVSPIIEVRISD